jgi:competence protein ComFC
MLAVNIKKIIDSVFPPSCVICNSVGTYLCENCEPSLKVVSKACCVICGVPLNSSLSHACSACFEHKPEYDYHKSLFTYSQHVQKLIHDFKYNEKFWVLSFIEERFADLANSFSDVDVVVPVPLHRNRLQQRGFNQSGLFAKTWARYLKKPLKKNLKRIVDTPSQTGFRRDERLNNLKNAFAITGSSLRGKRVLLVDDVHTTGATLSMAARQLKLGGAEQVLATSMAIVPKG